MFLGIFGFVISVVAAMAAAGVAYDKYGRRRDRRRYLPPGRLVTLGNRRLHIHESGSGEPAVIFESGLASSSLSWAPVQHAVAKSTRAISYDRAGIGWSDETSQPRSMTGMVEDLGALLKASGNPPPYVLVGHSFGGLLVRAFAGLRGEEVAGLILIDPVSLDFWADCSTEDERRLRLGARLSRRGIWLANLGVVRLALAALSSGKTRLPKAIAKASAGKAMGTMGRLTGVVQKLPPSLRPLVQSHWSQAKSFRALAEYLEILRDCARQARAMTLSARIPVTILSAGNATAQELEERERWVKAARRGRHVQIAGSGHWIQLENAEQVAAAVLEMVQYLRRFRNW